MLLSNNKLSKSIDIPATTGIDTLEFYINCTDADTNTQTNDNYGTNYKIHVIEDASSGMDAGNDKTLAMNIPSNVQLTGHLLPMKDKDGRNLSDIYDWYTMENFYDFSDWYKFNVAATTHIQEITITMTPPAGSNMHMHLFKPDGSLATRSTNQPGDTTQTITYDAKGAGDTGYWKLLIEYFGGQGGEYSFDVQVVEGDPITQSGTDPLTCNEIPKDAYVIDGTDTGTSSCDVFTATIDQKIYSEDTGTENGIIITNGGTNYTNGYICNEIEVSISQPPSVIITIQPTDGKDTYVSADYPDTNYGSNTRLRVGSWNDNTSFIQFDLSSIPAGSTINFATLSLYCKESTVKQPEGYQPVLVYPVAGSWNENTITYSNYPNYYSSVVSSTDVSGTGWKSWDVTDHVWYWVWGDIPNHGFYMRDGTSDYKGDQSVYYSSESGFGANYIPKLVVDYTPNDVITEIAFKSDGYYIDYDTVDEPIPANITRTLCGLPCDVGVLHPYHFEAYVEMANAETGLVHCTFTEDYPGEFSIDRKEPNIDSLTTSSLGAVPITITADAEDDGYNTDGVGIDKVSFYVTQSKFNVDGTLKDVAGDCEDSTEPYTSSGCGWAPSDGGYWIGAKAEDKFGNEAEETRFVYVDITAPVISSFTIKPMASGNFVNGVVNLVVEYSDASSVTIEYQIDGTSWVAGDSWDTTSVSDGPHTVTVNVTDAMGQSTTYNMLTNPNVDNAPPASSVTALLSVQTQPSFTVSWSGSDGGSGSGVACYDVQYRDGLEGAWNTWQDCIPSTSTSATFIGSEGHTYYFQSRAKDNAGNWEAYPGGNGDTNTTIEPPLKITDTGPSGTLTTASITLSATTNKNANCRWSTTNQGYDSMPTTNHFTSGEGTQEHSTVVPASEGINTYYVSCEDMSGTPMTTAVEINICTCASCGNCEANLDNSACKAVYLTENINQVGTCINNPADFNDKIFDCQRYTIEGDGSGNGIYLKSRSGNTIRNCVITNFSNAIYFDFPNANGNTLMDNTLKLNSHGVHSYATSNTMINNNVSLNDIGFFFDYCSSNTMINNTANSNIDGFFILRSAHNTLINNTANSNSRYGIALPISGGNNLIENTAMSNGEDGLYLSSGGYDPNTLSPNTINLNKFCSNIKQDIHNDNTNNSGDNNTCDEALGWDDDDAGTTGCKYSCHCYKKLKSSGTCNVSDANLNSIEACDCVEQALNDTDCSTVKLDRNITDVGGTCINWPADNKIFDCQGHTIDGDGSGTYYGIYLNEKNHNTIRNCVIKEFQYGITSNGSNNVFLNIDASLNKGKSPLYASGTPGCGIYSWGDNNKFSEINASHNTGGGGYLGRPGGEAYGIYSYGNNNNFSKINASNNNGGIGAAKGYGIYSSGSGNNFSMIDTSFNKGGNTFTGGYHGYGIESNGDNNIFSCITILNSGGSMGSSYYGIVSSGNNNNFLYINASNHGESGGYGGSAYGIQSSGDHNKFSNINASSSSGGASAGNAGSAYGIHSIGSNNDFSNINASSKGGSRSGNAKGIYSSGSSNNFSNINAYSSGGSADPNIGGGEDGAPGYGIQSTGNNNKFSDISVYSSGGSGDNIAICLCPGGSGGSAYGIHSSGDNNEFSRINASCDGGEGTLISGIGGGAHGIHSSGEYNIFLDISASSNKGGKCTHSCNGGGAYGIYSSGNYSTFSGITTEHNSGGDGSGFGGSGGSAYGIYSSGNYSTFSGITTGHNSGGTGSSSGGSNGKGYGVYISGTDNTLTSNTACSNIDYDIYGTGISNTGNNNTCDKAYGWNEYDQEGIGYVGCSLLCNGSEGTHNGVCICSSCADCTQKLNNPSCTTVYLNTDIYTTGTCINNPADFNNKIFDCQG
ncbi:MAG: hypothetical protein A7315_00065 [Candidatus Altiarchaeales archaeon WOR_SM1_79]|nr:MAG: hypothetical protein A7315_00065 [Candidatus Altiarchaeales archaeon WOR_SM1_79]